MTVATRLRRTRAATHGTTLYGMGRAPSPRRPFAAWIASPTTTRRDRRAPSRTER